MIDQLFHASRDYKCNDCGEEIEKGSEYIRLAIPPWEDYEGDVDDEGRSIYYLLPENERRWYTLRYHKFCGWY